MNINLVGIVKDMDFPILRMIHLNVMIVISKLWEKEIDYGQPYEIKLLDRMMFVLKTVIYYKVPFPQKVIISRVVEAMHLADEYEKIFKKPFMIRLKRTELII